MHTCVVRMNEFRLGTNQAVFLRTFGHTVATGVIWNDNVSYLFHAPRGLGWIGLLPASTSGIGTVLLSELSDKRVRQIYAGKPVPSYPDGTSPCSASSPRCGSCAAPALGSRTTAITM